MLWFKLKTLFEEVRDIKQNTAQENSGKNHIRNKYRNAYPESAVANPSAQESDINLRIIIYCIGNIKEILTILPHTLLFNDCTLIISQRTFLLITYIFCNIWTKN